MNISLEKPVQSVINKLKYEKDPTLTDSFLISLASWGLQTERPKDLPEPSLSDNYIDSNYILNDGFVDGETYVPVDTVAKIRKNLSVLSTINFPWIIWGYDIDIPEYVKYRNGNEFVYFRSVQDVSTDWNIAGSMLCEFSGAELYSCKWNKSKFKKEFSLTSKKIASFEGTFTYGNNCTYSVPQKITDNDGMEYTFCGHTATLHSKNLVTSTNDNGITMRYYEYFNNNTKYSKYGNNQYYCSMMRQYINSRQGYSEFNPSEDCGNMHSSGLAKYSNGFLTKFYKDTTFMKKIMNQVNRIWDYQNQSKPDICIDEIGLIPSSYIGYDWYQFNTTYDTSKTSLYSSLRTDALRAKYRMNIDGSSNSSSYYWWMRSAFSSNTSYVGYISNGGNINGNYARYGYGCSPLIVLG